MEFCEGVSDAQLLCCVHLKLNGFYFFKNQLVLVFISHEDMRYTGFINSICTPESWRKIFYRNSVDRPFANGLDMIIVCVDAFEAVEGKRINKMPEGCWWNKITDVTCLV